MISIQEAIELIAEQEYNLKYEIVPIEEALGRVGAVDLDCKVVLPPFDNSAMDGYGVKLSDAGKEVEVVGKILAGESSIAVVEQGRAVKIMTGAVIPKGCEAVVPKENTQKISDKIIKLPDSIGRTNIRDRGEDINKGESILKIGDVVDSFKIAMLASQGICHIKIYKKPKVAVFASGSELKLHYEKINESQIYNSNTPTLIARAEELGCEVTFMGKAEDSMESIIELIRNSFDSDLIVTSGGVSVGDADFTKEAFGECGFEELFSKIDIKPGKPTTFGKIKETYILNLPGNPLASSLNFEVFGAIIISKLSGQNKIYQNYIITKLSDDFSHKKGKNSVIPGIFDGKEFKIASKFSPGMVNVLNKSNGYILIDSSVASLKKGDEVKFMPTTFSFKSKECIDFFTKG